VAVIHRLERGGDVAHHALESLGHVIERTVGVDDRVLEETVGIDVGKQARHGNSSDSGGDQA
jgi:hypothetical protein